MNRKRIDPREIRPYLEEHYDLQIASIVPAPREFVAETYVVETPGGDRYFVKLWLAARLPPHVTGSLVVLDQLYRSGLTQINRPIPTRSGALYSTNRDGIVAVFDYIEGVSTLDYDLDSFGALIADLHLRTKHITAPIVRETFRPSYSRELHDALADVAHQRASDGILLGLRRFLREYHDEIERDWHAFKATCAACREADLDFVITHGDAAGNVRVATEGTIFVVDWDEILLAPPERDTWFLVQEPAFLAGYRRLIPDYAPKPLAYRFYVYNRYFEDLLGYVLEILGDESDEHRAWNLAELHNTCVGWLRPLIRAFDATP
jgi:spectinomycin phosphotransferase